MDILNNLNLFIIARTLHIVGVVSWIGGVAFVTTVLIPSLKRNTNASERMYTFERLEGVFSFQAKISVLLVGITGIYMIIFLDAWNRYLRFDYWWMHIMTLVWFAFATVLFLLEPLILHRWFIDNAKKDSEGTFSKLHRFHIILLSLSIIAIIGAMLGSHGFNLNG